MPEFEMPFDGHDDHRDFCKLDAFTQGYVQGVFFTECHSDNPELQDATFSDLAPEALAAILEDCKAFQETYAALLEAAYSIEAHCGARSGTTQYDAERAGTDYWFTRNGHGVGFWCRGLGETGEQLSEAARLDGSRYLYAGDDGKVYLS